MITAIASPFEAPVAPGILCVILDASADSDLQARIEQAVADGSARCVPLFDDTPYARLQTAGPFALLLPSLGAWTEYASALLERTPAGCVAYLRDEPSFAKAIAHWRCVLTVRTDNSCTRLLRFFDPRWLEPLLNSLNEPERLQFMGPVTHLAWRNEMGWRHFANPRPDVDAEIQAPGWLHLSQTRQDLMDQLRLKVLAERFAQAYQTVLPMPEPVEFVFRQLLAARQTGYLRVLEQERWLRLALIQGDDFWSRSPAAEWLARDDLGLGEKLSELERL
ncbi:MULTISPECIES: DUF4123 domain-containing protein [unclassified Pseudomonas]|uniref:DUF4123 domain-containing protein n=1 Tax=unclassified Pseudomonas TaxID=196821 RepID=UPI002AC9322B|nr:MULTISPECIES: DUF4123 domain-containing protein [unclassified Pseudomonas]MEB0048823.1 DUF4123 domain-containing protein [Pseudomonas sp. Dout3]MEB0099626.1 DUF4123 domain-containing protein [Pseudomonas sp. DC1.2]WPX59568.1 DUF4123 domain-containing protein [Pseudomonas sp. DC1.2]